MTEEEKMLSGKAYIASDEELVKERKYARKITRLFNQATEEDDYERVILLKKTIWSYWRKYLYRTEF